MPDNIQYEELIKTSSFGEKQKKVLIIGNTLTFENKNINLAEVTKVKYGMEPYQMYRFYVGYKYCIDLKTKDVQLKIEFKSFFRISINYFHELYQRILNEIWSLTVHRIVNEYITNILSGEVIQIDKFKISEQGIDWDNKFIHWNDLSYQKNYDRFTINSKSNQKIWTNIYYLDIYNIDVIINICDWAINKDGLKTEK